MKHNTLKRLYYRLRHDYFTLNNLVVAAAFLIAASWAWASIETMQQNYELQQAIDRKRQTVSLEKLRVELLEYEASYYDTWEYKELALRQRLGLANRGEKQLILPSTEGSAPPDDPQSKPTAQSSSNFQQWMKFLFSNTTKNR